MLRRALLILPIYDCVPVLRLRGIDTRVYFVICSISLPAKTARDARRPRRAAAMRQPSSGSAHKKNDDIGNEEQDLDALEFDGVLLQDRCAEPASPNPLATAASGAHFLAVE